MTETESVSRTSRRRNRRAASAVFFLLAAVSMAVAVAKLRHHEIATGLQFGAWSFLPLALLLGFTLPVQCRVMTTRGTACGNEAYGLLFGCNKAAGHALNKIWVRLFHSELIRRRGRSFRGNGRGGRARVLCAGVAPVPVEVAVGDDGAELEDRL